MKKKNIIIVLLGSLFFISGVGSGTGLKAQNPVLEEYIIEGLQSNLGLKQAKLDYAANLSALKEARGLFFPDLSLNARYTVAEGGRTIEFPVGDMLNPVYSTLNVLTGTELFPQIENQEFAFLRPREHETKMTLVQPIFNTDIIYNHGIRKQYTEIARIDVDRYKRELIKEITKAYYDYQKAFNLVWLADTSISLVKENLRVSQRLFENDKVTIDAVYRSESELSKVEVQRAQANNMLEASRAYFNFLLNRSLDASIDNLHRHARTSAGFTGGGQLSGSSEPGRTAADQRIPGTKPACYQPSSGEQYSRPVRGGGLWIPG